VLRIRIRDPGSGIRDSGWVKKDPDRGTGSRMSMPDYSSESLETIFWVKKLKFFDADLDPGSGNRFGPRSGIRDGKNSVPG
jgi:hypothetical protein